jgi:hypothetical protein
MNQRFSIVLGICGSLLLIGSLPAGKSQSGGIPKAAGLTRQVLALFQNRCVKCHGADKPKAGLDLRTLASIDEGSDSGPVLRKGSAENSLLFKQVATGKMPLGKAKLSAVQVRVLRDWINAGVHVDEPSRPAARPTGKGQDHWAFRPPTRPKIPDVREGSRARTIIDRFLLSKLKAKGLTFSPEADRATLLRRASLDLLGLPPTPAEVDAFLADNRPDAYDRVLDRLLASPHFGERWARHWLDIAGYTDTVGFDQDTNTILVAEGKWRYRDYVIAAFNDDLPYDRFVTEQLAGDELVDWRNARRFTPAMRRLLIATGYLRTARDQTHEPESNISLNYYGVLHDTVAIVGNGLLGLTLNCAQCHNHKFDPISQRDYYQLMALFTPAYNPRDWRPVYPWKPSVKDRGLPDVSAAELAEMQQHNRQIERQVAGLNELLSKLRGPHEKRLREARLRTLPQAIRADTQAALATPVARRNEVQKYLAGKFETLLRVTPEEVTAALSPADRAEVQRINRRIVALTRTQRTPGKIQALYDVGPPPPTYLLKRGNYQTPGAKVEPGFLSVLNDPTRPPRIPAPPRSAATSGRRRALAHWLTEPESRPAALLARVMVNRLWQHLFGKGLVASTGNFGRSGQALTHPELLEWLSSEFARSGWRIKPMLKLIMTSSAYRQSSHPRRLLASAKGRPVDPQAIDPGNRLLWRMPLRRLEAEAIRDALLAVSGRLDRAMGGPPVPLRVLPDGLVEIDDKAPGGRAGQNKRSVYLLCRRSYNLTLLTVFDQPLVAQNCTRRDASAVPLQSLTMLNDAFVEEQARHFADRVAGAAGSSEEEMIRTTFRLALARPPSPGETAICTRLLQRQAAAYRKAGQPVARAKRLALVQVCLALLNTSEFLYVE